MTDKNDQEDQKPKTDPSLPFILSTKQKLPQLLQKLTTWKPNEVVLDYGCGSGVIDIEFLLPLTRKHGCQLHCVDKSGVYITRAKKNYPDSIDIFNKADIMADNLEDNWPLKGTKFDKVFAIQVLQHMPDLMKFLRKIYEQMNPGGQFVAMVSLDVSLFHSVRDAMGRFGGYWKDLQDGFPVHADWATGVEAAASHVRQNIHEAGFHILYFDVLEDSCQYEDGSMLADFMVSLLTTATRKKLDEYVMKNLKKSLATEIPKILRLPADSKPINLVDHTLLLVAEKRSGR